uniref:Uncharacterized protein n=1 Tax=Caenorhabditis japonica TaxID=281687 RepID=A0A8R1E4S2_CAEJA
MPTCSSEEPPRSKMTYLERKVDEKEQKKKDNLHKLDELSNVWALLYGKLRKKMRDEDSDFEDELTKVEESLMQLLPSTGNRALVMRTDAKTPTPTAREQMHCAASKFTARKRSKNRPLTGATVLLMPKRNLEVCSICAEEDPPLPDDIDPQEYEFRITEWKRCALCLAPAHFSCTIATKTCQCSPGSFFELYSDNFQQEIDSDEN